MELTQMWLEMASGIFASKPWHNTNTTQQLINQLNARPT